MSGFAIYNYNFLRIIRPNEEYQLEFPDWVKVNVQESFENRQQLLEELLLADFENNSRLRMPERNHTGTNK